MLASERASVRADPGAWIRYGILGGVIAGVVFAMFEMIVAALMIGGEAFFMPLRMIGGIVLGPSALDPATSLLASGAAGLGLHMALSMAYGVATAAALSIVPRLSSTTTATVVAASVAGFALWIVNFYLFAPPFGWTWFPNDTNPVVQFVAHTFAFGTVLGLVLDRTLFAHRSFA